MFLIHYLRVYFRNRRSCCIHAAFAIVLSGLIQPVSSKAAPQLSCEVSQGGETRVLEFSSVSNPYAVKAQDINRRFRFKAVMVGNGQTVDYINLYIYYLSSGQAVLLYQTKFLSPVPQKKAMPYALTGYHYVYSPVLGREMQFGCALTETDS